MQKFNIGFKGSKHSEESKLKMRNAKLGTKYSAERLAKHVSPTKGKKLSSSHKIKISNAITGIKRSMETRMKISRAQYKEITETPWPMRKRARQLYQLTYGQIKSCEICGRENCRIEIHHKDENYNNNKIENLQPLCRSCHSKIHYKLKLKKTVL